MRQVKSMIDKGNGRKTQLTFHWGHGKCRRWSVKFYALLKMMCYRGSVWYHAHHN